jgi:predicted nucleotidyltransferase
MSVDTAVQLLVDAGVEFVIIGGWSAILHGRDKGGIDLDLCLSRESDNLRRLLQALAPFHPRSRDLSEGSPFNWDEATLRNATILKLDTDLGPIDLHAEVSGLGAYEEVKAESITVEAFGRRVHTLDLKSLIKAKRAAGRAKDIQILPELESLLEAEEP